MRPLHSSLITRTKLVATIGPATESPSDLHAVLEAGVDVCRLNFSHGDHASHQRVLERVRAWSEEHRRPVAVLGDLCGPKIRLGELEGEPFELRVGDTIRLVRGDGKGSRERLTTTLPTLLDELHVGQRVYIDDGSVRLLAIDRESDALVCTCTTGGTISPRKGVNLPDSTLSAPSLTEKDRHDLLWAIENKLDFVALSFVRTADDLRVLRAVVEPHGAPIRIIVKIEKAQALEHLDDLVAMADGVMVARGDLGVELDPWQVPLVQKSLVIRCREAGKPIIIATQMLQSMIERPTPTRAEVSDVANAILDGADAVMLSAETAAGMFPLAAVEVMSRVSEVTEAFLSPLGGRDSPEAVATPSRTASAVAQAAVRAAQHLDARLVAVWTATGETARLIARHRLPMPVVGLTFDERTYQQMNLLYGVVPLRVRPIDTPAAMGPLLDDVLVREGLARPGDVIVVATSTKPHTPGATDTVLIHRVHVGAR